MGHKMRAAAAARAGAPLADDNNKNINNNSSRRWPRAVAKLALRARPREKSASANLVLV